MLTTNVYREWHRTNTTLPQVMWGIRNNVNVQQPTAWYVCPACSAHVGIRNTVNCSRAR